MRFTITLLTILSLTACKKEYKCTCSKKDGTVFNEDTWKLSKKDKSEAQEKCDDQTRTYTLQYPLDTPSCTLN